MKDRLTLGFLSIVCLFISFAGCNKLAQVAGSTWHQKCGWKAKDYFDDPKVVALCNAIEANDLAEIDRQIAAGADVKAKGKDNMTPLLWAYPDNKLDRFTKLLEHGANPNVSIAGDFNTHGGIQAGDSVTHLACLTDFPEYFEAVFEHGGDPNLVRHGTLTFSNTPLFSVITGGGPNKLQHVQLLIEKGADLNYVSGKGSTPAMQAVSWGGQFDIALMLLEKGADYKVYRPRSNQRLIHDVALVEDSLRTMWSPQQAKDYQRLVKWLEDHGESVEQAKADSERWHSYDVSTPAEFRRKMDAEIAEREASEKAGQMNSKK